ncbi:hypothetical protein LSTR_LSTR008767 [Laodelphax striatellus]|uniref:Uncharacterized protein n=1 Tax=Laodelphax striatellus TaxID=195883 RepID=A0A482XPS3_LAOST|nr:hypothetical protein LSTR_LSTR008767 [Laodelphax striatellus]
MTDPPVSKDAEQKQVVEINIEGQQQANNNTPPNNETQQANQAAQRNASSALSALIEENVLDLLTQVDTANEADLRSKNTELLGYLAKLIDLLKEKTSECITLEKQNTALTQQSKSLKEVVGIVKDLLNIRNMEVTHLQEDISSMQEKINNERVRQNTMIEKMEHVTRLNASLKEEYQKQYAKFQEVRDMYEEKVQIVLAENERLMALHRAA